MQVRVTINEILCPELAEYLQSCPSGSRSSALVALANRAYLEGKGKKFLNPSKVVENNRKGAETSVASSSKHKEARNKEEKSKGSIDSQGSYGVNTNSELGSENLALTPESTSKGNLQEENQKVETSGGSIESSGSFGVNMVSEAGSENIALVTEVGGASVEMDKNKNAVQQERPIKRRRFG